MHARDLYLALPRPWKAGLLIASIPLAAIGGYVAMRVLFYFFPIQEGTGLDHAILTLAIIIIGLWVPYWILKAGAAAAHLLNWKEKIFRLKDIPKDKKELENDNRSVQR